MGNYRSDDVFTDTFPLFHVAGTIACGLGVFLAGIELLVMSPGGLRTPARVQGVWRLVAQYKATLVGGVPTSMGAILAVPVSGTGKVLRTKLSEPFWAAQARQVA